MEMTTLEINIPKEMKSLITAVDEEEAIKRNALLLYPYIQNETISHGRAAEILGISKMDLIEYYSKLGIPYLDQTKTDLEEELYNYEITKEKES